MNLPVLSILFIQKYDTHINYLCIMDKYRVKYVFLIKLQFNILSYWEIPDDSYP